MKSRYLLVAALLLGFSFIFALSCAKREGPKGIFMAPHAPAADGEAVWDYITKDSPYKWYRFWPGKTAFYKGTVPHGALLSVYVNDKALRAIKGNAGAMPNGSIIVKENYKPDKTLAAITVMYKVKGYNPAAGDWFWAKYSPGGKVMNDGMAAGKVPMCIKCHGTNRGNDYIMTARLGATAALPAADGKAVWDYVTNVSSYKRYHFWPGKTEFYKGTVPHGALLSLYVNDVAFKAVKDNVGVMPAGSIMVKENYKPDKTLVAVTVMYKVKGYNPAAGDWFWAKYSPTGEVMKGGKAAGRVPTCIKCHGINEANDYIMTGNMQ